MRRPCFFHGLLEPGAVRKIDITDGSHDANLADMFDPEWFKIG
jgi:hypothetical protein